MKVCLSGSENVWIHPYFEDTETSKVYNVLFRPAIYSDFIWIIQIFFLKFSKIQINWLRIQIFLAVKEIEIFLYKTKRAILIDKIRFFSVYTDFFSHSFGFCVISKWEVCILSGISTLFEILSGWLATSKKKKKNSRFRQDTIRSRNSSYFLDVW